MSCCTPNPCQPQACPTINVPGPAGQNAFAPLIANLTIPLNTVTPVSVMMTSTAWLLPGQTIFISDATDGRGTFTVSSITSPTAATLLWSNAAGDSLSGTVLTTANGAGASPGGAPGVASNGINAFTFLTQNYVVPPDFVTNTTAQVANSQWATVGQTIIIGNPIDGSANVKVVSIPDSTHIVTSLIWARGDVNPGTQISASNNSTVSPSGVASNPGERYINFDTGSVYQNTSTGATTLMSNQVLGGQLAVAGDTLDIEASFLLAQNGNTKTVVITYGATTILTVAGAQNTAGAVNLIIIARVVRLTASTQLIYAWAVITGGGAIQAATTNITTAAETLSGPINIVCTGQSSAATGDVKQRSLRVRFTPV